jgi:hypothetical protein
MPVTLAANALTTVERVKEQGSGIRDTDATQDAAVAFLVNAASAQMMQYAEREFKSTLVGSQSRTFRLRYRSSGDVSAFIDFGQWDAQTVTAVTVETQATGANTALNAAILQYQPVPVEQWEGVYTGINIYAPASSWGVPYTAGIQHTASVTGTWGYPSVPADVEDLCVEQVKEWLLTGYQVTTPLGIPGETDPQTPGPRHQLAWSVQQGLKRHFRAPLVA